MKPGPSVLKYRVPALYPPELLSSFELAVIKLNFYFHFKDTKYEISKKEIQNAKNMKYNT